MVVCFGASHTAVAPVNSRHLNTHWGLQLCGVREVFFVFWLVFFWCETVGNPSHLVVVVVVFRPASWTRPLPAPATLCTWPRAARSRPPPRCRCVCVCVYHCISGHLTAPVPFSLSLCPSSSPHVQGLTGPIAECIREANNSKVRGSDGFDHQSAVAEGIGAFQWVVIEPAPVPIVEAAHDGAEFYLNKVRKVHRGNDSNQMDFCANFKKLLLAIQAYVKEHHKTGLAVCLSLCLSVCLSVCRLSVSVSVFVFVSMCPCVRVSVSLLHMSVCLSVCLSVCVNVYAGGYPQRRGCFFSVVSLLPCVCCPFPPFFTHSGTLRAATPRSSRAPPTAAPLRLRPPRPRPLPSRHPRRPVPAPAPAKAPTSPTCLRS